MSKKQNAKKHHATPQSYLRRFVTHEDDKLFVYSKIGNPAPAYHEIKEIGHENYLYECDLIDGTRDKASIEDALADFDSASAPILQALADGYRLTPGDEQKEVALFIAAMIVRNPLTMRNIELISKRFLLEKAHEHIQHIDAETTMDAVRHHAPYNEWTEEQLRIMAEHAIAIGKRGEIDVNIEMPKGFAIRFFNDAARELAKTFCSMQWHILRSEGTGHFVTSDNPVFYGHYGLKEKPSLVYGQLGHPEAFMTFPISRHAALRATKRSPPGIIESKATVHQVNTINDHTIASATRLVFSPQKSRKIAMQVLARLGMDFKLTPDSPLTDEILRSHHERLKNQ